VNYGYDRIRFVKPVFIGDTISVRYEIVKKVPEKNQVLAEVTVTNQDDEVVTVATNILKFV
jgi:3-hydroxybutyryl-CoA dehydratase